MTGQATAVVRDGNSVVVGLLFGLAVLNDSAISDPGMPLTWPQPGEWLVAVAAGLFIAAVFHLLEVRAGGLRSGSERGRAQLALLSIAAGVAMGQLILAQMVVLAEFDPASQRRYLRFVAEPFLLPVHRTFSAAVVEEVLFRYIGMTAVALVVARRYLKPHLAYRLALLSTAVVFGLAHLPALSIVGLVLVFFNTLAGLLYGWMFWHWGLLYAILAHFAAGSVRGMIINAFGSRLFGV